MLNCIIIRSNWTWDNVLLPKVDLGQTLLQKVDLSLGTNFVV